MFGHVIHTTSQGTAVVFSVWREAGDQIMTRKIYQWKSPLV